MNEYIKRILRTFCYINTGSMLGAASFIGVFYDSKVECGNLLWQIAVLSLLIAIIDTVLLSKEQLNKNEYIVRMIIHYILTNIVIIGGGHIFQWVNNSISQNIGLVVVILCVYVFLFLVIYQSDKEAAEKLNERISEYNKKE